MKGFSNAATELHPLAVGMNVARNSRCVITRVSTQLETIDLDAFT